MAQIKTYDLGRKYKVSHNRMNQVKLINIKLSEISSIFNVKIV